MGMGRSRKRAFVVAQTATFTATTTTYTLGGVGEQYDTAFLILNVTTATAGNITAYLKGAVDGSTVYTRLPNAATSAVSTATSACFSYTGAMPSNLQIEVIGASSPNLVGDVYLELQKTGI